MAENIVTRLQSAWPIPAHSTHYEFCDQSHPSCAVHTLCNEIERLRAELEEAYDACRYALADSPRWQENCATVIATWEARRG